MLALGEEAVIEHIKTIGLYRNKAKNVIALSQKLVDDFDGIVPREREALMTLPGVGRKTANVVLNMWWGHPSQAVDTHIFRIGNRTGICPGKDVVAVERAIEAHMPVQALTLSQSLALVALSVSANMLLLQALRRLDRMERPPVSVMLRYRCGVVLRLDWPR